MARAGMTGGARLAAASLGALLALALCAPLIASSRPFYLWVPEGASPAGFGQLSPGLSFPWFTGLFDVRTFASLVDRGFNALLLLVPLALPAWFAWRRGRPLLLVAILAAAIALQALCTHSEPSRDYAGKVASLRDAGADVRALFPPVPRAASDTSVRDAGAKPSARFWLGTDASGRDVLARVLFGARTSLTIGFLAVLVSSLIGTALGAFAGTLRGAVDALVLRLIETVSCFPTLLLVMTIAALVGQRSLFMVMLVLGLTSWPTTARLVRAEFLRQSGLDYAVAARALGVPWWRLLARHLLPNALSPVLVTAAFGVANAILVESGLAFLNLGDPSVASWGELLRQGRESGALHLILIPGLLIFVTVTMMNLLAQWLRDRLDPRQVRP